MGAEPRRVEVKFEEDKVESILAGLNQCHLPGAAIGVAVGGRPVYRKGFGLASMEQPVVNSSTTRMRIYSMTKHFTCLAYLLLCEEGRARIEDSIGQHLGELHPVTAQVTVRQLMGHVSGVRDVCDLRWQFCSTDTLVSSADLIALYRCIDDANFPAGTTWSYNNGAYQLLSAAIERISGWSFEDFLRTRILEPVGLYDTQLRRFDNDFVRNAATMHMTAEGGGFNRSYLGGALAGEGGLISTVDDMLRWLSHMDAPSVGRRETWEAIRTPQVLPNGVSTGYGLGLTTGQFRGVEMLYHGGGGLGGNSHMLKIPCANLDVVVLVNRHDVDAASLAEAIVESCLPCLPSDERPSYPTQAAGVFHSPATGRVIQLFSKETRQYASMDGAEFRLEPDDRGVWWPAGAARYLKRGISLVGDPSRPAALRLNDYGDLDELLAVEPASQTEIDAIVGQYRFEPADTTAIISGGNDPQLHTLGQFGATRYRLELLGRGIWRARSFEPGTFCGGMLLVSPDCSGFRFSSFVNRALPFQRSG